MVCFRIIVAFPMKSSNERQYLEVIILPTSTDYYLLSGIGLDHGASTSTT